MNLGTNDWHGVPNNGSDPVVVQFVAQFTSAYRAFVDHVTSPSVYGEGVTIFLGVGPMTEGYLQPVQVSG
jgi:hypothetical protein